MIRHLSCFVEPLISKWFFRLQGRRKGRRTPYGDYVVNQTIPLILCAEEDVEGNHGASIGQLDEEMLFYLSSRGMSAESASKMIARARMDAVCQKIGDEQLEKLVQDYLEEE